VTRFGAYLLLAAVGFVSPAQALSLADCTRVTHVSHGGQADHVDLGEGRVMWRNWWSQEGSSTDMVIADCAPGQVLTFRTAEENMNTRPAFDRTDDAMGIVARHETGSRVFATLGRIASDLQRIARDITVTTVLQENCACAALYPQMRDEKEQFRLESL